MLKKQRLSGHKLLFHWLWRWHRLILLTLIGVVLATGTLDNGHQLIALLVVLTYFLVFGQILACELSSRSSRQASLREHSYHEVELGTVLIVGAYLGITWMGGLDSHLYPLLYALMGFLAIIAQTRRVQFIWLAIAIFCEWMLGLGTLHAMDGHWLRKTLEHSAYLLFFSVCVHLMLSAAVLQARREFRLKLAAEQKRLSEEAQEFRLHPPPRSVHERPEQRQETETRLVQGAVGSLHEQLQFTLSTLQKALHLQTIFFLWKDDRGTFTIKEAMGQLPAAFEPQKPVSLGILATMLANLQPLCLKDLATSYHRLPSPANHPQNTDLLAYPIRHQEQLMGILGATRGEHRHFDEEDQRLFAQACLHIGRTIDYERSFSWMERSRYEQEQFYRASELLNEALTAEEVYQKTFAAIRTMTRYDFAVITAYNEEGKQHQILASDEPVTPRTGSTRNWVKLGQQLEQASPSQQTSLLTSAIKNRHAMPLKSDRIDRDCLVFPPDIRFPELRSLLILPLIRPSGDGDQVVGAITLGSQIQGQFPHETREMLRVISHQVGVSLQNARMYQTMEQRATTDGLTGLTNHRAFQERLSQLHALAERSQQKYTIILTDIDHFKAINDTYGHRIGDLVLKKVAEVFTQHMRKVDVVARYGGEEFVILLPDTDAQGGMIFAEKLREAIAKQTMKFSQETVRITISLGVASYPNDAKQSHELIEYADQALYYCKAHGRNCVSKWSSGLDRKF